MESESALSFFKPYFFVVSGSEMYLVWLIQVDLIGVLSEDRDYFIRFVAFGCDFLMCCIFFCCCWFTLVLIVAAVMRFIVSTVIDLDVAKQVNLLFVCWCSVVLDLSLVEFVLLVRSLWWFIHLLFDYQLVVWIQNMKILWVLKFV